MDKRTTKKLKTRIFHYADGSETCERFAVLEKGKRIGTVHKVTDGNLVWFDPFRGVNGPAGDGKYVMNGFVIARKKTMEDAVNAI